jgi:putative membrane protein
MLRITLAWLHLVALAIGFGAVYSRGRSLAQRPLTLRDARRAFAADSWWGIAALLWLVTGLWRLFGSIEKTASYYQHNAFFILKMALFILILVLEIWPMITLIKWRRAVRAAGESWQPDERVAARISTISYIEAAILVLIVLAAVTMARGYGERPS